MRPRGLPGRRLFLALGDVAVAVSTFAVSVVFRRTFRTPGALGTIPVENLPLDAALLVGVAAAALAALWLLETWDDPLPTISERGGLLLASLLTGFLLLVVFFLGGRAVPRTVLPIYVPLLFAALWSWRRMAELVLPIRPRPVLVVGRGSDAAEATASLSRGEIPGYVLFGKVDGVASLATGPDGPEIPREVLDLVFVPDPGDRGALVELVETCHVKGVSLWLLPGILDVVASRPATRRLGDLPLSLVDARGASPLARALRRCIDLCVGVPLFLASSPLLLVASAAVALESPGAPWYRQRRVGLGGREIDVWKIRTMRHDAENETGPTRSKPGDERVTRVGAFLRRVRIDELPQLLLVILGPMSLIGPRPERPEFARDFEAAIPAYRLRYLLKPGLTGLAQVMGAYATRTDVKVRYDLGYLFHWTPLLDLFVLVRTVTTVLRASGV